MTRWQWIGSALVVLATLVGLAVAIVVDPGVPFLLPLRGAQWIGPEIPVDNALRRVGPGQNYAAIFTRSFTSPSDEPVTLRLRALGRVEVAVDERPWLSEVDDRGCLKRSCEVRAPLAAGPHELRVRVVNPVGPPLLALTLDASALGIASGERFEVAPLAQPTRRTRAIPVDDTRRFAESTSAGASPWQAARARSGWLALFFLCGVLASWTLPGRTDRSLSARALPALGVGVGLLWLWLGVGQLTSLPLKTGFDASGHIAYVRWLADGRGLPDASDGWSMYHPPLFYALSAIPVALFGGPAGGGSERIAMRIVPWLLAIGNLVCVGLAARRIFDGRRRAQATAVGFAALLPLHVLQASYVSNEIAHAFFVSAALVLAMFCMETNIAARQARQFALALGALLGLALLSKFTAWLVTAVVCAFYAFERWQARGASLAASLASAVPVAGAALLVGGGFYLRNLLRFGDPFVWNLDVPGQASWWVQPGFHTGHYFAGFGDALSTPFYSAFHSFWDAQYTSFWGDGLIAGRSLMAQRPGIWDWDWMSVGYLLALPATLLLASGAWQLARESFEHPDRSRRCSLALCVALMWLLGAASLSATLRYPFYGTPRASYALCLLVPLSLCAARGVVSFDTRLALGRGTPFRVMRAIYHGWLTTFGGALLRSYFLVF